MCLSLLNTLLKQTEQTLLALSNITIKTKNYTTFKLWFSTFRIKIVLTI
jgi:hypothetical protein